MNAPFKSEHWLDNQGRPAGGVSYGTGFCVSWQNGPLGRGTERRDPNGAFVETMLAVVRDRIAFYQQLQFNCQENAEAIRHIEAALHALNSRTARREAAQIEGTHVGT